MQYTVTTLAICFAIILKLSVMCWYSQLLVWIFSLNKGQSVFGLSFQHLFITQHCFDVKFLISRD